MADVFKTYDDIVAKHGEIDINDIFNKGSFAIKSAFFKDQIIRNVDVKKEKNSKYHEIANSIINTGRIAEGLYYIAHAKNGGYEIANNILEEICYIKDEKPVDLKTFLEENGLTNDIMNEKPEDIRNSNLNDVEELLDVFQVGSRI